MNKIKMKVVALAFVAALGVAFGGVLAWADGDDNASTVTVSPMSKGIVLIPGEE